ncbi:hypothetical protein [Microvirga sp. P5_D2]
MPEDRLELFTRVRLTLILVASGVQVVAAAEVLVDPSSARGNLAHVQDVTDLLVDRPRRIVFLLSEIVAEIYHHLACDQPDVVDLRILKEPRERVLHVARQVWVNGLLLDHPTLLPLHQTVGERVSGRRLRGDGGRGVGRHDDRNSQRLCIRGRSTAPRALHCVGMRESEALPLGLA